MRWEPPMATCQRIPVRQRLHSLSHTLPTRSSLRFSCRRHTVGAGVGGYPRLLNDPRARVVGGWAANAALIGAAVLAVQFSLDGFGLPAMANRFVAADPATRAALGDIAMMSADVMIGLAL